MAMLGVDRGNYCSYKPYIDVRQPKGGTVGIGTPYLNSLVLGKRCKIKFIFCLYELVKKNNVL